MSNMSCSEEVAKASCAAAWMPAYKDSDVDSGFGLVERELVIGRRGFHHLSLLQSQQRKILQFPRKRPHGLLLAGGRAWRILRSLSQPRPVLRSPKSMLAGSRCCRKPRSF